MRNLFNKILPLFPLLVLAIGAELLIQSGAIASYLIPAPSHIFQIFISDYQELMQAFLSTALSSTCGLLLSSIAGLSISLILSISPLLRKLFYPYAIFFQTVPIIAIAPLLIIWFGFGRNSVIASSFIVSVFPIIASCLTGLLAKEKAYEELFQMYQAGRWRTFVHLKFPRALPFILNGLKISSGLAIIGAIVGEFMAGIGLGSVIDVARLQYRVDKVFAAVLLAAILGLIAFFGTRKLTQILLGKWHSVE